MDKRKDTPKKIALLTDSCADMPKMNRPSNVYIVPLRITCGGGEFLDGVNIGGSDIYAFHERGELPKTSLPAGEDIEATFDRIAADGYDGVIGVMFSSGLSGTYEFVKMLAEEREMPVKMYDSKNGSLGLSMIILQLALDIERGADWEYLTGERVDFLIKNTFAFFSVDSLEYLHKGGRIGYITAAAGTLLGIKPIITFAPDGKLITAAKVRGSKQLSDKLVSLAYERGKNFSDINIAVANGGLPAEMEAVQKELSAALPVYKNCWSGEIGAVLSAHIGKGILGSAVQILK